MSIINNIENLISESDSNYVSLLLSDQTITRLNSLIKKYNIPNPVKFNSFHITLFNTKKRINIPKGVYKIECDLDDMKNFTIMTWSSNKKNNPNKRLIVLEFTSYQLIKFRNHLINILEIPLSSIPLLSDKFHITLSYNIGSSRDYPITKDIINSFPLEIINVRVN